jgi:BirA family transcriptional regulator, biotin operon repressor / biotin---[acetyl-CoA-carboxylase] ligase
LTIWPPGYALEWLEEIDSTNAEARRRAVAGESGPLWIAAARQTAGRGRRGRVWQTLAGNLSATLLLRPAAPPDAAAQLSFAAALAAADMAQHFAPGAAVTVKWPNDVLADGRKLAGILLESGNEDGFWLAIGIGVNLAHFPPDTEFPATSLATLGGSVPAPEQALIVLADRFAHWHAVWRTSGFEVLRDAWLARADRLGARIRARLPREEQCGVFEGIDASGALLLNQGHGRVRTIAAAEIFW